MEDPTYYRFGAALAIGGLIGLERQIASQRDQLAEARHQLQDQIAAPAASPGASPPGTPTVELSPALVRQAELRRAAGLRTMTLVSLCGALAAHLAGPELPWVFPAAVLAMGGLLLVSYQASVRISGDVGLTSEVVALVTFLLGGLCARGETTVAGACAVIVTGVLSLKERLHGFSRRVSDGDIQALLKFAVLSMVVLPILPAEVLRLGELFPAGGPEGERLDGQWVLARLPSDPGPRYVFAVEDDGGRLRGELIGATTGDIESAVVTPLPAGHSFGSYVFDLVRDEGITGTAAFTRAEDPTRTWTARWNVTPEGELLRVEREWLQDVQGAPWVASSLGQGGRSFRFQRLAPPGLALAGEGPPRALAPPPAAAWWRTVGLSPRKVWYMVVLISAVSFAGYVLNKTVGAERGMSLTAILGGFASSTATSLAFAQRSRESPELAPQLASGILVANAIMPLRLLVLMGLLAPALVPVLLPPLVGLVGAVGLTVLALRWQRHEAAPGSTVTLTNPFEIGPALKFGAIFGVVLLLAQVLRTFLGDWGLYALALLTGLTDVDPIALAVASLVAAGQRDPLTGATMITLAVLSNTALKGVLVASMGHVRLRTLALGGFGAMLLGTGLGLFATRTWLG